MSTEAAGSAAARRGDAGADSERATAVAAAAASTKAEGTKAEGAAAGTAKADGAAAGTAKAEGAKAEGAAADTAKAAAAGTAQADRAESESHLTVVLALLANLGVALLKLVAGLVTGSGALLSEAAHSFGDTSTELLLLTALRRSGLAADLRHPFGYGKERYFWSLLAAMGIFISGAIFSVLEGIRSIIDQPTQHDAWLNYLVLLIAAGLEGASLRQGLRQARGMARRQRRSLRSVVRDPGDPTVKSVVLEDSVALIGLALAALGVGLHQLTGSATYDGAASLAIGLLLVAASMALAQTCKSLLVGQQADPRLLRAIEVRLEEQPEVDDVVDLLSMQVGPDNILLCARIDFIDSYSAADLESACVRIDVALHEEFAELGEIFLQPAPSGDRRTQQRVRARYGRQLSD